MATNSSTIEAGNFIYQVYPKNASALVTIDDNGINGTDFLVFITPSLTIIDASLEDSITLTVNGFSSDFKNIIINRYAKYKYYYDKYNTYNNATDSSVKEYIANDILEQVKAYLQKIEDASNTIPGLIDSSAMPYYNSKLYDYINKFQNKIEDISTLYYTDGAVDMTKITSSVISNYKSKLLEKYKSLDDLHLLPIIIPPSKSLSGSTIHKFKNSSRSGGWHPKWVDKELQYYKDGKLISKMRASKALIGKTDKAEYDAASSSLLTLLYYHVKSNTDITITISADELYDIYSEVMLSINNNGYNGRYYFKEFKKYLHKIGNRKKLKYFKFKYMIVDLHTSRIYTCKSSLIKYNFPKPENSFISILVMTEFTKKTYWEGENIDSAGLNVIGIYNTSAGVMQSRDITDEVSLEPCYNLSADSSYDASVGINVVYDDGESVIQAIQPIVVTVKKQIPLTLFVNINSNNTILNLIFDNETMIDSAIVEYTSGTLKNIINSSLATYISSPEYILLNNTLSVSYTENSYTINDTLPYIGLIKTLNSISMSLNSSIPGFYSGQQVNSSDLNNAKFVFEYVNSDLDYQYQEVNYHEVSTLTNGNKIGFEYKVNDTLNSSVTNNTTHIIFYYYNNSTSVDFLVIAPINVATVLSLKVLNFSLSPAIYSDDGSTSITPGGAALPNVIDVYGSTLLIAYSNGKTKNMVLNSSNTIYGDGSDYIVAGYSRPIKTFTLVGISMDGKTAYINNHELSGSVCYTEQLTINDASIAIPGYYYRLTYVIDSALKSASFYMAEDIILYYNDIIDGGTITLQVYNTAPSIIFDTTGYRPSANPYVGPSIANNRIRLYDTVLVTFNSLVGSSHTINIYDKHITFTYEGVSCNYPITVYKITKLVANNPVLIFTEGDTFNHGRIGRWYTPLVNTFNNHWHWVFWENHPLTCTISIYALKSTDTSSGLSPEVHIQDVSFWDMDFTLKGYPLTTNDTSVTFSYHNCTVLVPIAVLPKDCHKHDVSRGYISDHTNKELYYHYIKIEYDRDKCDSICEEYGIDWLSKVNIRTDYLEYKLYNQIFG